MGFALTLLYIALTLLSPAVFPQAISSLHIGNIVGVLVILAIIPSIPRAKLGSTPETYIVFGVLISASVSILASGWVGGAFYTLLGLSPILLAFYFLIITCTSLRRLKILTVVLLSVAFFIFFRGAFDYFTNTFPSPYLEPERIGDTVLYRFRGLGIISDPNDLSQVFIMLIPLLWLWWKPGKFVWNFLFTLVPAGILAVAIYFTHSRGAVVAFMAILLYGLKDRLGLVRSSIFAAVAFAGLMALNVSGGRGMDEDDGGRVAAWSTGLELVRSHPLFGVGVDNFGGYNDTSQTAHNSYILSLAETGMFGYFFWMGMIVSGWSGLSKVIPPQSKKTSESDSEVAGGPDPLKDERPGLGKAWLATPEMRRPAVETGLNPAAFSHAALYAAERNDLPARPSYYSGSMEEEDTPIDSLSDDNEMIYSAKVLRIAFVGLLTSAFFISRSYSITLYVMLGMVVALRKIYQQRHPTLTMEIRPLLKRICQVIFASVVLLYLFVRVRGIH